MDPTTPVRKPMFAKKSSCGRKEMKKLKRMRQACKLEMAANGCSNGESPDRLINCLISPDHSDRSESCAEVYTNRLNCSFPKEQNILPSPPPSLNNRGSELVVSSNVAICNGSPQESTRELPKRPSGTNSNKEKFLSARALQDVLYQLYEEEGYCFEQSKPVEVHLDLVVTSCLPDDSTEPKPPLATVARQGKERHRKPQLGNSSHVILEQERDMVSHSYQEASDSSVLPVETPRKKRVSEFNNGNPNKRLQVSDGAGDGGSANQEHWQNRLEKIKSFIQDHLDSAVGDFDHKLQHVNERLDSTQCLKKHEAITTKVVKKISKLDRRVNGVIAVQKAELSQKAKLPGSDSSNMILNCPKSLPFHTNSQLVTSTVTTSAGSKDSPIVAESITSSVASPQEAGSSEDVICLDAEDYHSPDVPCGKAPDDWQTRASVTAGAPVQTPDNRKSEMVIDLTEESSTKPDALGKEEEKTASNKAKPAPEAPKIGPPQQALPTPNKRTLLLHISSGASSQASARQAGNQTRREHCPWKGLQLPEQSCTWNVLLFGEPEPVSPVVQVPGEGFQLPPLPKIRPLPELVTDFKGTLPPQKLELTVVKLLNPKGVALQLDVSHVDTRCASLESIHLFFFVENSSTKTPFSWTQLKVIKALPLPMFVSLGELPASGTYYFTMQSKDIYGRYGPFCDIRAISVT